MITCKTIGVFPASGALGGSTVAHLRKLIPNDRLILINRHPDKVPEEYRQAGIRLRYASYESSPEDLEHAFSDVEVLFLVSYPSHVHDYRVQIPAVDAAVRAGVSHIFYSSLAFAGPPSSTSSKAVVMQAHLDTEAHLRALASAGKVSFTSLREGLYAESFPIYTAFFDPAAPVEEITIPHDGGGPGVAWAKREELGEATARLIAHYAVEAADDSNPEDVVELLNQTLLLTGPRAWTLQETAGMLGARIREVSIDEYVALPQVLGCFGGEADKARTWATAWEAIRAGETAVVSPLLGRVLQRPPEEFDVALKKHLASLHK